MKEPSNPAAPHSESAANLLIRMTPESALFSECRRPEIPALARVNSVSGFLFHG